MTKEEAWQRHLIRVQRLLNATNKGDVAQQLKRELMQQGYDEATSERIVRESWNYAKAQQEKNKNGHR